MLSFKCLPVSRLFMDLHLFGREIDLGGIMNHFAGSDCHALPYCLLCVMPVQAIKRVSLLFRDIKPHNVMLDVDNESAGDVPVLLDFGSMGVARVNVTNISEARALQVPINGSYGL